MTTKYRLTKSQYAEKVKLIQDILAGKKSDYIIDSETRSFIKDDVIEKMDKDGLKRNAEYINMQVELQVYNEANRYANEILAETFKKNKYIPAQNYDKNKDTDDGYIDDYTDDYQE